MLFSFYVLSLSSLGSSPSIGWGVGGGKGLFLVCFFLGKQPWPCNHLIGTDDDFDVVAPIEPHVHEQDLISMRCIPLLSDDGVQAVDGSLRHMIARCTVSGTLHADRSGDSDCIALSVLERRMRGGCANSI